jgi:ATP-GRASP peptide maturase of grasp-with-spasm system
MSPPWPRRTEEVRLSEYVHFLIENVVPRLGSSTKADLNKMLVLHEATKVGLLIPKFYVSNEKRQIEKILKEPSVITKAISDGLHLFERTENSTGYFSYTEKIDSTVIQDLPELISPSFLQHQIHKAFDVRVFYLEDKCYSMAILSQANERTKVDFRRYSNEKPNRCVPYRLPVDIDRKLKKLFAVLDLNTGSADLVADQQDNLYFLEINPVGQFGMVSEPCNYLLEREIALHLRSHARKR